MTRRQSPISVNLEQRRWLEEAKSAFENKRGSSEDWGSFLKAITLLGLTAIGIMALASITKRSEDAVTVECPACRREFLMALPEGTSGVFRTSCPHPGCGAEVVVDVKPL